MALTRERVSRIEVRRRQKTRRTMLTDVSAGRSTDAKHGQPHAGPTGMTLHGGEVKLAKKLRIVVTGICAYVLDAQRHHGYPFTVVVPDGRQARVSRNSNSTVIPAHQPFVLFNIANIERDPHLNAGGRGPDLMLANGKFGVCVLHREQIYLENDPFRGIVPNLTPTQDDSDIRWVAKMSQICPHAMVGEKNLDFPPRGPVSAQLVLASGLLKTHLRTSRQFIFRRTCGGDPINERISQAIAVEIDVEPDDQGRIRIGSRSFDGGGNAVPPLVLKFRDDEDVIQITFGNAPLSDLEAHVALGISPSHDHGGGTPDAHFELYYMLADNDAGVPLIVPIEGEGIITRNPDEKLPGAGNCPIVCGGPC